MLTGVTAFVLKSQKSNSIGSQPKIFRYAATHFFVSFSFNADTYSSGQKIYVVLYLLNIKDIVSYYNSLTNCYMYQSAVKASDVQMITL